ncbi:MAG: 30S ribosome-binding factor RbfA [Armatimonadetes bacterium]|nr:30S ribosome-binding factor RbfA [Anaerolineae bacterium]
MTIKQDRMADKIRLIISELLLREIGDPALQGVTITEVKLDPELMFADVFVNALGDETRRRPVLEGLKRANGFLRREVGKRVRLRNTPELHFHWDVTLERGEYMNQVLGSLHIPERSAEDLAAEAQEFDFDTDDDL